MCLSFVFTRAINQRNDAARTKTTVAQILIHINMSTLDFFWSEVRGGEISRFKKMTFSDFAWLPW